MLVLINDLYLIKYKLYSFKRYWWVLNKLNNNVKYLKYKVITYDIYVVVNEISLVQKFYNKLTFFKNKVI